MLHFGKRTHVFRANWLFFLSQILKWLFRLWFLPYHLFSLLTANTGIIIELDANTKLGSQIITGDHHEISENGKLLLEVAKNNNFIIVNSTKLCEGIITRVGKTDFLNEESTIDFILVYPKMFTFIAKMKIDEERTHVLTRYSQNKNNKNEDKQIIKESDHNPLIWYFNIKVISQIENKHQEIFNFWEKNSCFPSHLAIFYPKY